MLEWHCIRARTRREQDSGVWRGRLALETKQRRAGESPSLLLRPQLVITSSILAFQSGLLQRYVQSWMAGCKGEDGLTINHFNTRPCRSSSFGASAMAANREGLSPQYATQWETMYCWVG